jgi:hypothetical protein
MNKMIHKFQNFKIKILKLSTRQLIKFSNFQIIIIIILIMAKMEKVLQYMLLNRIA